MSQLAGRTAIVTGGGWNIGRAVAIAFAAQGARVVVTSRNRGNLERTVEQIAAAGGEAFAVPADLESQGAAHAVVREAEARYGPVDVLAALAGGGAHGQLDDPDDIEGVAWESVFRRNFFTAVHAVRAVLPSMRARDAGSILLCSGGGAFFPLIDQQATAYGTAKAAICRLTDQLTADLWHSRIRVHCVDPGLTWSPPALAAIEEEERRTGAPHPARAQNHPPEATAELALWLVSERSRPVRGRVVSVDDTWWRDPARAAAVEQTIHLYRLRRCEE